MNTIEWWMIDGAVGLIVLVAVLRGAIKGVGDTVIKILCIVGGIGLGVYFKDRLKDFLMTTKLRSTMHSRIFELLRGDEALDPSAEGGADSYFKSIISPSGTGEGVISKSLGGIFKDAADKAADTAAERLTEIAMGVIAVALIILAVSLVMFVLRMILKSLRVALVTTVVCLLLGYPFAYYIARKPADVASRLIMLLMIPLWTNSLMRLNAWMLLFQTNGPVNKALLGLGFVEKPVTFLYTDGLVLLGLITNFLPFAVLPMYSSIEKLQTAMLEASADLGAKPSVTFFRVTLPLTFPGIFSAIILTFIPALGTYTITDMLGGGKVLYIGNIIKNQFGTIRNWPLGAALSVLLLLVTALLIFVYSRFAKIEDMEVL